MAGLLDGIASPNNFGPLTPEQEARLRKQAVTTEMPAALELLLGGGIGGVGGRAVGRAAAHGGEFLGSVAFPTVHTMAGMAGHNPSGIVNWLGRIGGGLGALGGMGAAFDVAKDRARRNTMRDAEGQDGGFYGPASPMDAEGQPGGFYGRRTR